MVGESVASNVDKEMNPMTTILLVAAVITVPARAELEPVGESGPQVRVIVCGVANSPKEIVLPAGAGARGALFLTNNSTSYYGWVPRTLILRGERIYQIRPGNQPDVRLEEGDFLEIPLRAPYQEMAKPKKVLIEVDSRTKFTEAAFTPAGFNILGTWRTNWLAGIKGRELRITDEHVYHSVFVSPCPTDLSVAKSPETQREPGTLDQTKNYFLLTFHEIRAIDQEPKHEDREAKFVSAVCRKFGGTAYLLHRDLPGRPWVMTPFKAPNKSGSNKARQDNPLPVPSRNAPHD
jgi:hypothetical protein